MAEDSNRDRLPFEPKRKRDKPQKSKAEAKSPATKASRDDSALNAIPEDVSRRMIRRMVIFCGVPTGLGLSSFFLFYFVATQGWFDLPPYVVFYVTLVLFGLGVVGLSYGILSTSWESDRPGGIIGWREFTLNAGRLFEAWRTFRQTAKQK
ncbi:MAG: PAM68 family protein [Cyanobacteria bacterium P01_G01_bin.54]